VADRTEAVLVTLSFLCAANRVLFIRVSSKKDRFAGLWNGIGGHVQSGEDIRLSARREIKEETGHEPTQLRLRGVIHEPGLMGKPHLLFLFTARVEPETAETTPKSTEEGDLAWFELDRIPWQELVPDLRQLLPRLLNGEELLFGVQEFDGTDRPLRLDLSS
jgi:8-oxo-dGTP diphosphatase